MAEPIPLLQRTHDYNEAERVACEVAERWLEARTTGLVTFGMEAEMDEAQRALLAAKRRYEKAMSREMAKGA